MFNVSRAALWVAIIPAVHRPVNATQGQPERIGQFEVASVHPNRSGDLSYRIRTPAGERFTATNVTIRTLLREAFNVKNFQISGAPGWTDTERYDIAAKLDPAVENSRMLDPDELGPLIQGLLVSRFQLRIHHVTKQLPVFTVVAARGGPRLHPNTGTPGHETDWGKDHINAHDVTIAEFCRVLESQPGRVVVDDTKVHGTFDFGLTWTPDLLETPGSRTMDSSGASIFTVIREQYGLELKPGKGPVDVIVIDHVERPSAN